MRMLRRFLILILAMTAPSLHAGIARWNALPALDVLHLQGAYAGTRVCPMCRHGYDAGLLVLLPSSTPPERARDVARRMRETTASVDDARFRAFLVLAGGTPSAALQDALRHDDPRWFVALLDADAIGATTRAFGADPSREAQGYVFAQRRVIASLDPSLDADAGSMREAARHARALLQAIYPEAVDDDADPDQPRGRLWLAPSILSDEVRLPADGRDETAHRHESSSFLCIENAADAPATAGGRLIGVSLPDSAAPARTWWARSDASDCIRVASVPAAGTLQVEVFGPMSDVQVLRVDARQWREQARVTLTASATSRSGVDAPPAVRGDETIIGLPCEGCDAAFAGLPSALRVPSRALERESSAPAAPSIDRIAAADEPGEALQLHGVVRDAAGIPRAGVVLYAYQTDARGIYPPDARLPTAAARHGRLRGWTRTDAAGRYAFDTIRPGAYPTGSEPQHIHLHVIEPARCTYYIGDVLFDDDPRLDADARAAERDARGGSGIVHPLGDAVHGWRATRDITLGRGVPGYDACARGGAHDATLDLTSAPA